MRNRNLFQNLFCYLLVGLLAGFSLAGVPENSNLDPASNLRWREKKITVSISNSIPAVLGGSISKKDFENSVRENFGTWARATGIEVVFRSVGTSSISAKESGGDGVSLVTIAPTTENLLLFGERNTSKSAVTRLFFDGDGFITEADIVLNPIALFTNDGSRGSFDLDSTLIHEAGHFLGLGHSDIVGSTMHRHQGKNGVFALPATYTRTLSEDDMAGIRSLYGPPAGYEKEFGSIEGVLEGFDQDAFQAGAHIWIESLNTGKVIAGTRSGDKERFRLGSVPADSYRIFAVGNDGVPLVTDQKIIVERGRTTSVKLPVGNYPMRTGSSVVFGFNGQLADLAVPVETGHVYSLLLGSKGLNPKRIGIESTSPGVFVDSDSISHLYTNGDTDVIGFEIFVTASAEPGDYSFRVFEGDNLVAQIPGAITVDQVQNLWFSSIF